MTSRWFALRGIFNGTSAPPEPIPAPVVSRAPALAGFSLAGGVGKTSLVATLGRALSARGERVLLVDTAPYGLLPFFFCAGDQRGGVVRILVDLATASGAITRRIMRLAPMVVVPMVPDMNSVVSVSSIDSFF